MMSFLNDAQIFLVIGTVPFLLFFFTRRTAAGGNAVWGGATGGLIIGLITSFFVDTSFLKVFGWGFVIGTYLGILLELPDLIASIFGRRGGGY